MTTATTSAATLGWVGKGPRRFLVRGRDPYLSAAIELLTESGCAVKKWRKSNTGVAYTRSPDWEIEVPEPRGPSSYSTLAHEIGHQELHRPDRGGGRALRWVEEVEAEEWALATFDRFELPGIEQARDHVAKHLAAVARRTLARTCKADGRDALAAEMAARFPAWALDRMPAFDPADRTGYERRRIELAEKRIADGGYELRYVEYCEDAETPGLLGQIAGVTDHARRTVKVARRPGIDLDRLADTLEHEACHVEDPAWDCGNRDVFGRGGPDRAPARGEIAASSARQRSADVADPWRKGRDDVR